MLNIVNAVFLTFLVSQAAEAGFISRLKRSDMAASNTSMPATPQNSSGSPQNNQQNGALAGVPVLGQTLGNILDGCDRDACLNNCGKLELIKTCALNICLCLGLGGNPLSETGSQPGNSNGGGILSPVNNVLGGLG